MQDSRANPLAARVTLMQVRVFAAFLRDSRQVANGTVLANASTASRAAQFIDSGLSHYSILGSDVLPTPPCRSAPCTIPS
jgi:hypothetical protein